MAPEDRIVGALVAEPEATRLLEVVELSSFAADIETLLTVDEREAMRNELAMLRQLGTVIRGTGGVRKFRWGAKGKGKRAGIRVIYYYGGDHMPIFLLAVYAKNEKTDLSPNEKSQITKLVATLNDQYRKHQVPPKLKQVSSTARRRQP